MRQYVIWNPTLSRRNGPRVLQALAIALRDAGQVVFRYAPAHVKAEAQDDIPVVTDELITPAMRRSAVIVYPEVVAGNPLRFRNVVRWVLYYPGRNGGNFHYYRGDKIFAFAAMFFPDVPLLTPPWIDRSLFYDDGRAKIEDCCFVHKGGRWKNIPELNGLKEITMHYPATRTELADLLRSTRVLYSFDDCSSVLDEAELCGAKVQIVTKDGFREYKSKHPEVEKAFSGQLHSFIEQTSEMDWQGPLENRFQWRAWLNSLWLFGIQPLVRKIRDVLT